MSRAPLVELEHISKTFPGVRAVKDVSVAFYGGEVHALMGENGAGKSTLMKILSGAQRPDSGRILIDQQEQRLTDPLHAQHSGIGMVYQELTVLENLDVGRNLMLGREPVRAAGIVDWKQLYERAGQIVRELELGLDVRRQLSLLSVGEQQMVEIARVASREPRIIIMDEPTSALGREEEEVLFELIGRLKRRGVAIAYVSHRLSEVFQLSNRITVLRDGHHIFSRPAGELDRPTVIQAMVGKHVEENYGTLTDHSAPEGNVVLRARGFGDGHAFDSIDFELHSGEVLGVAGLMGSGRTELFEALFGLRAYMEGTVEVSGRQLGAKAGPKQRMAAGLAYVPSDRKRQGLVLPQPLAFNLTLSSLERISRFGFRLSEKIKSLYDIWSAQLSIRATSRAQRTETLSGGNQQKVLLAKWLAREPVVLVLNEPTRGVDVGAKAEVHRIIRHIAVAGVAVVVISSELPELLAVSDRIMVMWKGRSMAVLERNEATEKKIVTLGLGEPLESVSEET